MSTQTLKDLAPVISEAKPEKPSQVKSFLLKSLVPVLYLLLPGIIEGASDRTKKYLAKARDVLNEADLPETPE